MKTADILIDSVNDVFFALCELDRNEADRILDESVKMYDAAPEKVERDLFTGSMNDVDKPMVLADFALAITEAYKRRWVSSLDDTEAVIDMLKSIPSGSACITIASGVSLTWSDIDYIIKEAKAC